MNDLWLWWLLSTFDLRIYKTKYQLSYCDDYSTFTSNLCRRGAMLACNASAHLTWKFNWLSRSIVKELSHKLLGTFVSVRQTFPTPGITVRQTKQWKALWFYLSFEILDVRSKYAMRCVLIFGLLSLRRISVQSENVHCLFVYARFRGQTRVRFPTWARCTL